ncbi:MAG: hypothetical protein ABI175_05435 [Polyangiales bacterium]
MSEREFLRRWEGTWEELVMFTLQSSQQEGAVLAPLAAYPQASLLVIERVAASEETNARCVGASLAGRLGSSAPLDLLDRLLARECARLSNGHDPFKVIAAQTVVDAVVFAAARWCRDERARPGGLALCRKVVERTIDHEAGEYWSSAPYAMVTLVRHRAPDVDALLARFAAFADGPPPDYVTAPTLQNERACARALAAGVPAAIGRVDAMIDKLDGAPPFPWGETAREHLDEWLALAKEIG